MRTILSIIYILISVFLWPYQSNGQRIPASDKIVPHTTLTLEDKVNKSDAVIEGEIIKSESFLLDPKSMRPFTSSIIRVSRIFKGEFKDTIVELISEGGTIPSGEHKGEGGGPMGSDIGKAQGIFFLRRNNTIIQSGKHIDSYFFLYANSYIYYTLAPHLPFHSAYYNGKNTSDFEKDLYQPIEAITGTPRKVIELLPFEIEAQKKKK